MSASVKNRRKNYFIDKSFQSVFIFKFCIIIIIATILIGIMIYCFNLQTTTVAFENLKVVVKTTADFILPITVQIIIIVTLIASISTIVITMRTSHKIAGPLYALTKELNKMNKGDFTSAIHIRSKDQLKNVIKEFDEMRQTVSGSLDNIKYNWLKIKPLFKESVSTVDNDETHKEIKKAIDVIDKELNNFKTN